MWVREWASSASGKSARLMRADSEFSDLIRLIHESVEHPTDALTLIGDGQQSIYPGGYTTANSASRSPAAASS